MPCGLAEGARTVADAAQHGGVERAAAEVVDGDDAAVVDPLAGGEVHGGGLRLGDERRLAHAGERAARSSSSSLYGPQLAGWAIDDRRGGPPWRSVTVSTTCADDGRHQPFGGVRRVPEDDRRGVAEAALELLWPAGPAPAGRAASAASPTSSVPSSRSSTADGIAEEWLPMPDDLDAPVAGRPRQP